MKNLFPVAALTLLLAGCGAGTPNNSGLGTGSLAISGHIANYSPASGAVLAQFYTGSDSVSTGNVSSTGNFAIKLVAPNTSDYKSAGQIADCSNVGGSLATSTIVATPAGAQVAYPILSFSNTKNPQILQSSDPTAGSQSVVFYVYAAQKATVTGTTQCSLSGGATANYAVNLAYTAGWNLVQVDVATSGTGGTLTYKTVSGPVTGTTWYDGVTYAALSKPKN